MTLCKKTVAYLLLTAVIASAGGAGGAGCNNAKQGAVSGAGVGALTGLAIGSLSGNAGKGAAIGAVVGGIGGAVVGNENKKKADAERTQARANGSAPQAPPPTVTTAAPAPGATVVTITTTNDNTYQTGPALGRLVGSWNFAGVMEAPDGKPVPVNGTAKAAIDKTYFLRIDLRSTDSRDGSSVEGTSVISQRGGRSLEMTNSFSSSPLVRQFRGEMDESGTLFSFTQFDPSNSSRKVIIRVSEGRQWTADVWDGSRKLESYTFTPAN